MNNPSLSLRFRCRAAGLHLALSAIMAACIALLTLGLWYPGAYGAMAGGRRLFLLLLGVDVILGPVLTFVAFNQRKSRGELMRDLATIAALQVGALAYGLHTVYIARPVALVHEGGRFRLVTANDVRREELPSARAQYRNLSLTGPLILGTRASQSSDERIQSIDIALKGYDIGQRPSYWQPYRDSRESVWAEAKPLTTLTLRYPTRKAELEKTLQDLKLSAEEARYLPVVAREDWVVVLSAGGNVVGYAPFDGF